MFQAHLVIAWRNLIHATSKDVDIVDVLWHKEYARVLSDKYRLSLPADTPPRVWRPVRWATFNR